MKHAHFSHPFSHTNRSVASLRGIAGAALLFAALAHVPSAAAQPASRELLDLNRQAMDAYTNLELDQAKSLLEQALTMARERQITGRPLATTYMNLGVVTVGGFGDNAAGLEHFTEALRADGTIQLDPLNSTPDIQTVFSLARARAGSASAGTGTTGTGTQGQTSTRTPRGNNQSGNNQSGNAQTGTQQSSTTGSNQSNQTTTTQPPTERPTVPAPASEILIHTPSAEQLRSTALPVFVGVPANTEVGGVFIYYKSTGMRDFRRAQMARMGDGYGFEIPCSDVFEPEVAYYVTAFDQSESQLGFVGTADAPVRIPIVGARTVSERPALPGRPPPQQCAAHEEECPPGMTCDDSGNAGLGDTCASNRDCQAGLHCEDDFCVAGDRSGRSTGPEADGPRFFVHLGGALGLSFVSTGMTADSPRPATSAEERERLGNMYGVLLQEPSDLPAELTSNPGYTSPWQGCERVDVNGSNPDGPIDSGLNCQVRVTTPGFVPNGALKLAIGYYVTPNLAIALTYRLQPGSGQGILSNMFIGARVQYLLTTPSDTGLNAAVFVGGGGGQIQAQPPQGDVTGPFATSGYGGITAGGSVGYRFIRNVGVVLTPELYFMLPSFMFNMDIAASVEVAF